MFDTLDTFHFEMSELNSVAPENAAESKKEKRERGEKRRSEKILEHKRKKKWGKGRRERGHR